MKKNLIILGIIATVATVGILLSPQGETLFGAPSTQLTYEKTLLPITDSQYDLGTSTLTWRDLFVDQICLSGDCKSAWPVGGGGGGFSWPFNPTTNFGQNVQATSTALWLQGSPASLFASSTSKFSDIESYGAVRFATTSASFTPILLSINGTPFLTASTSASVNNLFLGLNAGKSVTRSTNNVSVGANTLSSNTTGNANTAMGDNALTACIDCDGNAAFGFNTLDSLVSGAFNSGFGWDTLTNTTGNYNSGFGVDAFLDTTTGSNNTAIGVQAGRKILTGSSNTFVGTNAGNENETSLYANDGTIETPNNISKSTAIGFNAQVLRSNSMVFGGTLADSVFAGFGTTTPRWALQIASTTAPQLALTSGPTESGWTLSASAGNFYIASSSPSTFATSSIPQLLISNASTTFSKALYSQALATSTFLRGLNLEGGCFAISGTCIGGGAGGGANSKWATSSLPTTAIFNNNNGNVGIGTTTPRYNLQLSSSTASQLALTDGINSGWAFRSSGSKFHIATTNPATFATSSNTSFLTFTQDGSTGRFALGSTSPAYGPFTVAAMNDLEPSVFDGNVDNYFSVVIHNRSGGTTASSDFVAVNDLGTPLDDRYYMDCGINGSTYSNATFSGSLANGGYCYNQDGEWVTGTASTTGLFPIKFLVGGMTAADEAMRIGRYRVGIGTTTSQWPLQIASSTRPQLALSSGSTESAWTFSASAGNFYIASSSPSTFATSSIAQFSITNASTTFSKALYSSSAATSSFQNGLNIAAGCFSIAGTCIGGGSGGGANSKWATSTIPTTAIFNNNNGNVGIGTTTPRFNLQLSSSTAPQLNLTDGSATSAQWNFRAVGTLLYIATSSPGTFATSTFAALTMDSTGPASLSIGSSTPTLSAVNGMLTLGANGTNGAGTSTIQMGKIQFDGLNSAGSRTCAMIVGTAWVILAGPCTP